MALLLPAVNSARESARTVQCRNNLKQLGAAIAQYNVKHGSLPIGSWCRWDTTVPQPYSQAKTSGLEATVSRNNHRFQFALSGAGP